MKQNKKTLLIYVVLAAAIIAVYWPVYKYDFVKYDDDVYVTNNKNIQTGLNWQIIKWAFTSGYASNWHPLTWLSHTLDYQLYGEWAGGHHITNVLFHIANTLLLFYFLKKATNYLWPALFVAAAFALHPLHVESVAWIAERKDVLSALFWILTMIAYVQYVKNIGQTHGSAPTKLYSASLVLFALGLMSKPMLVTMPFVLLLLDYWPLERKFSKRVVIEKIPFFIFSILSSVVTFIVQQKSGAITAIEHHGLASRAGNIIVSYAEYIFKTIWPAKLAVLYQYPVDGLPLYRIIISAIILCAITFAVLLFAKRYKFILFGWLWYLGTLVPVIGFIQIGAHSMADRYTYIPLIGIFITIFFGAKELFPKRQKFLFAAAVGILIASSVTAAIQVRYWKDSLTLFEHTIRVTEKHFIIMTNYAACLNDAGRYEESIIYTQKLIKMKPDSAENHNCLGNSLMHLGRIDEAIDQFQLATKCKPIFPQAWYNLGVAVSKLNNFEKAALLFEKAIEQKSDYLEAYVNLAISYNQMQRFDKTIEVCSKALAIDPANVYLHGHLAMALSAVGRNDEAIKEIRYVLSVRPDDSQMYRNLGILLSQKGLKSQAIEAYRKALQIDPNDKNVQWLLDKLLEEKKNEK
ncbi:MAG: tetratricopeptide repeat protein [Phycisphaerales bacterium]